MLLSATEPRRNRGRVVDTVLPQHLVCSVGPKDGAQSLAMVGEALIYPCLALCIAYHGQQASP